MNMIRTVHQLKKQLEENEQIILVLVGRTLQYSSEWGRNICGMLLHVCPQAQARGILLSGTGRLKSKPLLAMELPCYLWQVIGMDYAGAVVCTIWLTGYCIVCLVRRRTTNKIHYIVIGSNTSSQIYPGLWHLSIYGI